MPKSLSFALPLACALCLQATPLHAESLLEKIFGSFGASSANSAKSEPQASGRSFERSPVYLRQPNISLRPVRQERDLDGKAALDDSDKGRYKTVCVRMCDGFYWPLSSSVRASGVWRDASVCRRSCNEDARLFYEPALGEIAQAVDVNGRSYSALPNAYLYRKKLIAGCTCKPEPWTLAERERHQVFAQEAEAGQSLVAAPARPLTGVAIASNERSSAPETSIDQDPSPQALNIKREKATRPARQPRATLGADNRSSSRKLAERERLQRVEPISAPSTVKIFSSAFGLGGPVKYRWPGD